MLYHAHWMKPLPQPFPFFFFFFYIVVLAGQWPEAFATAKTSDMERWMYACS